MHKIRNPPSSTLLCNWEKNLTGPPYQRLVKEMYAQTPASRFPAIPSRDSNTDSTSSFNSDGLLIRLASRPLRIDFKHQLLQVVGRPSRSCNLPAVQIGKEKKRARVNLLKVRKWKKEASKQE
ncbi:hypothetical protein ACLOJK_023594 [Asimina triloba]